MNNANIHDDSITQEAFRQQIENLPTEILDQPRFFPVAESKVPLISEWQKPENQHHAAQIQGLKGFDTCGHGQAADYLLVDFDHVLDDAGNFIYPDAERWLNYILQSGDNVFCERSISGHGLHILIAPTTGKFPKVTNSDKNRIYFDKETGAKIELFYLNAARYCLVTGNLFRCEPNATIPHDEDADEIFQQLLNTIAKNQPMQTTKAPAPSRNNSHPDYPDDTPEYNLFRAKRMLDVIPPAELGDTDWLAVQSACKNIGIDYPTVDEWCSRDKTTNAKGEPRYNEAKNKARWDSLNDPSYDIETLHGKAQPYGYSEADTRREWNSQHKPNPRARIAELEAQPQSEERDKEIIAAIRDACEWRYCKDANGTLKRVAIKPTFANMKLIFDNDPNIQKLIGFDEFQSANVFLRQPPWRKDNCLGGEWADCDDALLRLYIRENYGELSNRDLIQDFALKVSRENAFHPVKDYFRNLPPWDGTPRAEELFIKFLRVDDTPFAREVTLNWLTAAIARIFNPGCRYQTALVLHGRQKIGKSYIVERLGGQWYMELVDDVDDTHASDAIKKGWIVELKEMAAMRKAELNKVKAFIERSAETRRLAYGHHPTTLYRHCVFVITVNDTEFLRDTTGNRRYLILHCNSPMFGYVEGLTDEYISQVWAEVYQRYNELFKDGFDEKKLELSRATQFKAEEIATHYMQDDGLLGEMKGYLDTPKPADVVWLQLTKEERRKFIADGKIFIGGGKAELETRIRNRKWNKSSISDDVDALWKLLAHENEGTVYRTAGDAGLYFYGTEQRQHICMTEIFNECFFGNDSRKKTYRIAEILTALDGWTLGERLRNADPQYPDQTKPYYRNEPAREESQPQTPTENLTDLPIDPLENPPF